MPGAAAEPPVVEQPAPPAAPVAEQPAPPAAPVVEQPAPPADAPKKRAPRVAKPKPEPTAEGDGQE
ncbi:MAG: hypothetical protein HGA51_07585 [Demequinaceae bacterium]|nr:hypothetical protein [Demequinaceae bacterium]